MARNRESGQNCCKARPTSQWPRGGQVNSPMMEETRRAQRLSSGIRICRWGQRVDGAGNNHSIIGRWFSSSPSELEGEAARDVAREAVREVAREVFRETVREVAPVLGLEVFFEGLGDLSLNFWTDRELEIQLLRPPMPAPCLRPLRNDLCSASVSNEGKAWRCHLK